MPKRQVTTIQATTLSRMSIWLYATYALVQGIGITIGGATRWQGPAFAVVRHLPGSPWSWGIALVLFGSMALFGSITANFHDPVRSLGLPWWLKAIGLGGICIWSLCFGTAAFYVAYHDSRVGTTGGPVYYVVGVAVLLLIFVNERTPSDAP